MTRQIMRCLPIQKHLELTSFIPVVKMLRMEINTVLTEPLKGQQRLVNLLKIIMRLTQQLKFLQQAQIQKLKDNQQAMDGEDKTHNQYLIKIVSALNIVMNQQRIKYSRVLLFQHFLNL